MRPDRGWKPITSADDALHAFSGFVVLRRTNGEHLGVVRVRLPGPKARGHDRVWQVVYETKFCDVAWERAAGWLQHMGIYAGDIDMESRGWRLIEWLSRALLSGRIPSTVELWPNEAFAQGRREAFAHDYPGVWAKLIAPGRHKAWNKPKIALIERFGRLSDKQMAAILAQKAGKAKAPHLDVVSTTALLCADCGEREAHGSSAYCQQCFARKIRF